MNEARVVALEKMDELRTQYWDDLDAEMELLQDTFDVVDQMREREGGTERQRRRKAGLCI